MSTPYFMTSPATPRKEAAERYSPEMAEAFHMGPTEREATNRSDVVLAIRTPHAPMATAATVTATTNRIGITVAPPGRRTPSHGDRPGGCRSIRRPPGRGKGRRPG